MTHDEAIDQLEILNEDFPQYEELEKSREALDHAITIIQRVKWLEAKLRNEMGWFDEHDHRTERDKSILDLFDKGKEF